MHRNTIVIRLSQSLIPLQSYGTKYLDAPVRYSEPPRHPSPGAVSEAPPIPVHSFARTTSSERGLTLCALRLMTSWRLLQVSSTSMKENCIFKLLLTSKVFLVEWNPAAQFWSRYNLQPILLN